MKILRKIVSTITIIAISINIIAPLSFAVEDEIIEFEDDNLKQAIIKATRDSDGIITKSELEQVTELDLSFSNISNLSGIENATNLRKLYLTGNKITDISPLKALFSLTTLNLTGNPVKDIKYLAGLRNIKTLRLNDIVVNNFSILQRLDTLEELYVSNCNISDTTGIEKLTNLTRLIINRNKLTGYPGLINCRKLTYIDISYNQIDTIDPFFTYMPNIEYIYASNNKVGSFFLPKNYVSKIHTMDLANNNVTNVEFVRHMSTLKNLNLANNKIAEVNYFSESAFKSAKINLSGNQIEDISPLKNSSYVELNFNDNKVSDVGIFDTKTQSVASGITGNRQTTGITVRGNLIVGKQTLIELPKIFSQAMDETKVYYTAGTQLKSDSNIVIIEGKSVYIKPKEPGTQNVEISISGGKFDGTKVNVEFTAEGTEEITPEANMKIYKDDFYRMAINEAITGCSSSNTNIVTINSNGEIHAKGVGNAVLTITTASGTNTYNVTVLSNVAQFKDAAVERLAKSTINGAEWNWDINGDGIITVQEVKRARMYNLHAELTTMEDFYNTPNLEYLLYPQLNSVTDFTPVNSLKKLKQLIIYRASFESIADLQWDFRDFKYFNYIAIHSQKLKDLTGIEKILSNKTLNVCELGDTLNDISDLSLVENLSTERLNIGLSDKARNIDAIKNINATDVNVKGGGFSDISGLQDGKFKNLNIENNNIEMTIYETIPTGARTELELPAIFTQSYQNGQITYSSECFNNEDTEEVIYDEVARKIYIVPQGTGNGTVTVNSPYANLTVYYYAQKIEVPVTNVSFNEEAPKIKIGTTSKLEYSVTPSNATIERVWWRSLDENIATVDSEGNVTGINIGKARISLVVYTENSAKGMVCEVEINNPIQRVELNKTRLTNIVAGNMYRLEASHYPANPTDSTVRTWTSSNEKVATVDRDGWVKFIGPGEANITVTVAGVSASCYVSVVAGLEKIEINPREVSLNVDNKYQLELVDYPENSAWDKTVTWYSSDENIATVDRNGLVTAKSLGRTTIVAQIGEKIAICNIVVAPVKQDTLPFGDISKTDWYYNSVKFVYQNKIIMGKTETLFKPNDKLTRGQLSTILWRMEGSPKPVNGKDFADVRSEDYYYEAVTWASGKGIINGYGDGKFGPNKNVTREQLAVMIYNYARYKKKDMSKTVEISKYKDASGVASYGVIPVKWAIANKIISGKDNGTRIDPRGNASRAEASAMIQNYYYNVK